VITRIDLNIAGGEKKLCLLFCLITTLNAWQDDFAEEKVHGLGSST